MWLEGNIRADAFLTANFRIPQGERDIEKFNVKPISDHPSDGDLVGAIVRGGPSIFRHVVTEIAGKLAVLLRGKDLKKHEVKL